MCYIIIHAHIYIYIYIIYIYNIHIHCAYVRISIWYKIWIASRSPDHLGFSPAHTVLGQHRDQVPQEKLPEDAPEQTPAPRKGTKHHQHRHQLFFFISERQLWIWGKEWNPVWWPQQLHTVCCVASHYLPCRFKVRTSNLKSRPKIMTMTSILKS